MLQKILSNSINIHFEFDWVLHVIFIFNRVQHSRVSVQVVEHK
jgi:hypothetical protein